MRESEIQKTVIDILNKRGILVIRVNQGGVKKGNRYYTFISYFAEGKNITKGISDLIVITKEKVIFWELKAINGKLRDTQETFMKHLNGTSGVFKVTYGEKEALDYIESIVD